MYKGNNEIRLFHTGNIWQQMSVEIYELFLVKTVYFLKVYL